nr:hypothetical protein BgiMline_018195 [Biomphalaria glabrata]
MARNLMYILSSCQLPVKAHSCGTEILMSTRIPIWTSFISHAGHHTGLIYISFRSSYGHHLYLMQVIIRASFISHSGMRGREAKYS